MDKKIKWQLLWLFGHILKFTGIMLAVYFVGLHVRENGIHGICEILWYGINK